MCKQVLKCDCTYLHVKDWFSKWSVLGKHEDRDGLSLNDSHSFSNVGIKHNERIVKQGMEE